MPVPNRPDLRETDPAVRAYVEYLEAEIERLEEALATSERETVNVRVRTAGTRPARPNDGSAARESYAAEVAEPPQPAEPPTTKNLISVSAGGAAKRTPRHLYGRQRRGGMGIFDLETPESDPPAFLTVADEAQHLILLTSLGRAFRMPVKDLPETPVRGRGISLAQKFNFLADERLGVIFPDNGGQYLLLVTQRGQVRRIRYHFLGENVLPGTLLYDIKEGGAPAAACWSPGDSEIFIVTRQGLGIRFAEKQVPVRGCLGIRVDPGDVVAGVAAVPEDGRFFALSSDGKGAARDLVNFTANKTPGSGGKVAMKAERVVGAAAIGEDDDIFAISRLGKLIRFRANEVPPKEGPVQGVNCMALRADECTAMTVTSVG